MFGCNCRYSAAIAGARLHTRLQLQMLGCNCRCLTAIADVRLQLQILGCSCRCSAAIAELLSCNCRLQIHSAGSPPKRGSEQKAAQLQLQIANALCRPSAHEGIGAKQLGCNCRLQIHSAGPPPRGGVEPHINRQIRPRGVKRGLGMQNWV